MTPMAFMNEKACIDATPPVVRVLMISNTIVAENTKKSTTENVAEYRIVYRTRVLYD